MTQPKPSDPKSKAGPKPGTPVTLEHVAAERVEVWDAQAGRLLVVRKTDRAARAWCAQHSLEIIAE